MRIEAKIDFNDYLKLNYLLGFRRPAIIFFICVISILSIKAVIDYFATPFGMDYFSLLFPLFFIAIMFISVYRSSKRNYDSNGRINERIIYEFNYDKIIVTGESFSGESDWKNVYKVVELKNWILIYQQRTSVNIITKSAFGYELDTFKQMVKLNNVKAKFKN